MPFRPPPRADGGAGVGGQAHRAAQNWTALLEDRETLVNPAHLDVFLPVAPNLFTAKDRTAPSAAPSPPPPVCRAPLMAPALRLPRQLPAAVGIVLSLAGGGPDRSWAFAAAAAALRRWTDPKTLVTRPLELNAALLGLWHDKDRVGVGAKSGGKRGARMEL